MAKLHYTWERNSETKWANDLLTPETQGLGSSVAQDVFLAWHNPNYNVHMLSASVVASW